jgi:hypothetical protein
MTGGRYPKLSTPNTNNKLIQRSGAKVFIIVVIFFGRYKNFLPA